MSDQPFCPFCALTEDRWRGSNAHAYWVRDIFPVSPGHSLIILRRHVASIFEATAEERLALFDLVDQARAAAEAEFHPDAWNIGINDGELAGQSVPHLHVHLMPRFAGDVADPRGGVRWVVPDRADYWSPRG